jgi:hypothetical protein
VDRLFDARKAIHETTRNNTNEVSSKFEFSHFDFLSKAASRQNRVYLFLSKLTQGLGQKLAHYFKRVGESLSILQNV